MNEEFVPYDLSIKLKEKGFYETCFAQYFPACKKTELRFNNELNNMYVGAPTIGQVLEWFRRKHGLHVAFACNASGYMFIVSDVPSKGGTDRYYSNYSGPNDGGTWDEFEDCAFAAIGYVLNNLIRQ